MADRSLPMLQAKLSVNTPGDKYEQEADRVADMVMRMPEPTIQRECATCGAKSPTSGECPECKKKKQGFGGSLQRLSTHGGSAAGMAAPPIVTQVLNTPGSPLPTATRTFMESRFGQDFSHVRVHTDSLAAASAAAVQAKAYTIGSHIAYGAGSSTSDQRLLAHELTHTLQQGAAGAHLGTLQRFVVQGCPFTDPLPVSLSPAFAVAATQSNPGEFSQAAKSVGLSKGQGVDLMDVASYGVVVHLEKVADGKTGDHQPSGGSIKEAIRVVLHTQLSTPLTRQMAKRAYEKAITIVVPEKWHQTRSRTYGGRNTQSRIQGDSVNLSGAAVADWTELVIDMLALGFTCPDLNSIWNDLEAARTAFYNTGKVQTGNI